MELLGIPVRPGSSNGTVVLAPSPDDPPSSGSIAAFPLAPIPERSLDGLGGWAGVLTASRRPNLPSKSPPTVGGISLEWLVQGDRAGIDGTSGVVQLPDVTRTEVVTVFLEDLRNRILLLKRSPKVGSFPGHWGGVSGFLERGTAQDEALREMQEETGVDPRSAVVAAEGVPLLARGGPRMYVVHPFRVRVGRVEVRIDWEHTEFEWVLPGVIRERSTVPKLWEAWTAVRRGRGTPTAARKES